MSFFDWLRYPLSILVNKMTAASRRFQGVCEENLDKVLNDYLTCLMYTETIRLFAVDF